MPDYPGRSTYRIVGAIMYSISGYINDTLLLGALPAHTCSPGSLARASTEADQDSWISSLEHRVSVASHARYKEK